MLDMDERMMKEEDINDILTELPLPVGELSYVRSCEYVLWTPQYSGYLFMVPITLPTICINIQIINRPLKSGYFSNEWVTLV